MTSDVSAAGRVSRAGECIDGRYQLETEIGAGGLGSVYRATQTKLARQVAVKLLHEHMGASEVQRVRFEREARALAALEHPNIVSILDYGVADDQPYIVTELLEGETLAQRLRAGALPLQQGLDFADELLDALAFMHEAGVVHRDLKASNVFLQRVHQGERVKLLDFGLAKTTVSPGMKGDDTLTRDGTVVGTPAYMSPEQATGDVVDARSDVYAVGVLLYQMLTGRLPFTGDAIDQVRSHLVEPVPALDRTSPSPRLDAALERVIRRAMAKRREERFATARAMLEELREIREARTLPPAAARTQALRSPRLAFPPLGAAVRWLRTLCVVAVVAQLLMLVLLARDAQGRAALVTLGARSRVALSTLGERGRSLGAHLAELWRGLPQSERSKSLGALPSGETTLEAPTASRATPSAANAPRPSTSPRAAASAATAHGSAADQIATAGSDGNAIGQSALPSTAAAPTTSGATAQGAPPPTAAGTSTPEATAQATAPPTAAGTTTPGATAQGALPPTAAGPSTPGATARGTAPSTAAGPTVPGTNGFAADRGAGSQLVAANGPTAPGASPLVAASGSNVGSAAAANTTQPLVVGPEVSPDSPPGAVLIPAFAATETAAPVPPPSTNFAVPGPPKARNPWSRGTPAELRGIRSSVQAGGIGDDRVAGVLRSYTQNHPGDPRAQLLLGVMYLNRNWRSDAVAQFASAIKTDLAARGAPEVLDNLTELVATGKAESEASALIMRAYGTEALPALDKKISNTHAPDAVARLRALRARIDRAQSPHGR